MDCSQSELGRTLIMLSTPVLGFLGLAVALAGAVIATAQYRLAERRRKDELFDRRYAFYQRLRAAWLETGTGASPDQDPSVDILDLTSFAEEASFLFGRDIADHIYSLAGPGHQGVPWVPDESFIEPFRKYLALGQYDDET